MIPWSSLYPITFTLYNPDIPYKHMQLVSVMRIF